MRIRQLAGYRFQLQGSSDCNTGLQDGYSGQLNLSAVLVTQHDTLQCQVNRVNSSMSVGVYPSHPLPDDFVTGRFSEKRPKQLSK